MNIIVPATEPWWVRLQGTGPTTREEDDTVRRDAHGADAYACAVPSWAAATAGLSIGPVGC